MRTTINILSLCACFSSFSICVNAQGTFQNLNFEGAFNLPVLTPPSATALVPIASALPGWVGYANGTNQVTQIIYNGLSGGGAAVTLVTSNTANSFYGVIGGSYTVTLTAGTYPPLTATVPTAIAQTSLVPVSSLSLRFSASGQIGDLAVSLDGQNLAFVQLAAFQNYSVYGCDVSAFSGLVTELRFTERPISNPFATVLLDNILFSAQPIPEPSVFGLFGLGAILFGCRSRFLKKHEM